MRRFLVVFLAIHWTGAISTVAPAAEPREMGWVEKLTLEPWGFRVKAKLDTGALTSSLHAEDIERFERDGNSWVRFTIEVETVDDDVRSVEVEQPVVRRVEIRHSGGTDNRSVVEMVFCLAGELHKGEFTLNDRGHLLYPVLLGRRLLTGLAVVDPARTFVTQPDCGKEVR